MYALHAQPVEIVFTVLTCAHPLLLPVGKQKISITWHSPAGEHQGVLLHLTLLQVPQKLDLLVAVGLHEVQLRSQGVGLPEVRMPNVEDQNLHGLQFHGKDDSWGSEWSTILVEVPSCLEWNDEEGSGP